MTKTKKKGIICAVFSSLLLVLLLLTSCGTDEQGDVKTDEKGFYSYDGYVVKTDYPLDEDSINKAAEKVKKNL